MTTASRRTDDTRPGPPRVIWEARFPWEGARLLAHLDDLPASPGPLHVQAFVSESPEVRAALRGDIARRLPDGAVIRVRSAYKTGYFWLTEEVRPLWRRHHADHLTVTYPVQPDVHAGRFLQELYPLAALLREDGLDVTFQPGGSDPQYRAALSRNGREVWSGRCFVPLHGRTSPDGRPVPCPTGWLTVRCGATTLLDARVATDAELVWAWYEEQVMPEVLALAASRPSRPSFRNLTVTARLSEPDVPLGVLNERASMTEALSEEVYFGTLDLLKRHAQVAVTERHLTPGRIAPLIVAAPQQDATASAVLTPWGDADGPAELPPSDAAAPPPARLGTTVPLAVAPWTPEELWAQTHAQARRHALEWRVPTLSVQGRPVPAVLRPGTNGVLLTGGQHANETTGPVAAVTFIGPLAESGVPFAALPLENPDGAHLHRTLIRANPEHMHHAARYTALGDDLEARLRTQPRWETRGRVWAAQAVGAALHLNLHGYPAHEWTRPYSGYAPYGFESWALPAGFVTVLWHHPGLQERALALADRIARRLHDERDVVAHTARAYAASAAHLHNPHYVLVHGLPFVIAERAAALCPLTVITEAPDETIYGASFELFVRAHLAVCTAALDLHQHPEGAARNA